MSINIPSTTYKGLSLLNDPTPRTRTDGVDPGAPELTICTPVTAPCRASMGLETVRLAISCILTVEIGAVRSPFLCVPYPTTTTSSRLKSALAFNWIFTELPVMATVFVS
ncbi:hypothetical protein D3C87_1896950 [compost metagenome]